MRCVYGAGPAPRTAPVFTDVILMPGALQTVFQPIVRCGVGGWVLHALECLTRGPAGTPYARASTLFAAAHRRRLETEVDRACLTTALETVAHNRIEADLFLNVHQVTLVSDGEFSEFLAATAARNGISPTRLTIEVIEQGRDCLTAAVVPAVQRLKTLGVRVALDDFGAAATDSQALDLCAFRPDLVKVDGELFRTASRWPNALRRLSAVVRQARRQLVAVVAEGVERVADLQLASHLGIELVQGHHVCKPLPADRAACAAAMLNAGATPTRSTATIIPAVMRETR